MQLISRRRRRSGAPTGSHGHCPATSSTGLFTFSTDLPTCTVLLLLLLALSILLLLLPLKLLLQCYFYCKATGGGVKRQLAPTVLLPPLSTAPKLSNGFHGHHHCHNDSTALLRPLTTLLLLLLPCYYICTFKRLLPCSAY